MIRLHGYWRSSAAWRCRIALALKGIAVEPVSVHLTRGGGAQRTVDFRTLNPQALVPLLETGHGALTQSLAIIEWLEEEYPDPPLLPDTRWARAQMRAFALAIACEIHPLQNLRVQQYLRCAGRFDEADIARWLATWIGGGLAACEASLAARGDAGRFAFGDTPGLADICLAPQLYSARRFGVDLAAMPRLRALETAYGGHPAFVAAHADNQPDSEI